jgi:hypothetical protein
MSRTSTEKPAVVGQEQAERDGNTDGVRIGRESAEPVQVNCHGFGPSSPSTLQSAVIAF